MAFDDWELPEETYVRVGRDGRTRCKLWARNIGCKRGTPFSNAKRLSQAYPAPISLPSSAPTDGESTVIIGPAKGRI